ncbi:MAG: hypothetical protein J5654_11235 [Victivallales bacterium]|nr:hypothetical protein [Victivallales bacterium]
MAKSNDQKADYEDQIIFGLAEIDPLATMVGIANFQVVSFQPRAFFNKLHFKFPRGAASCMVAFEHVSNNHWVCDMMERRNTAPADLLEGKCYSFTFSKILERLAYQFPHIALAFLDIIANLTGHLKAKHPTELPWDYHIFHESVIRGMEYMAACRYRQLKYIIDSAKAGSASPEEELAEIRWRLRMYIPRPLFIPVPRLSNITETPVVSTEKEIPK